MSSDSDQTRVNSDQEARTQVEHQPVEYQPVERQPVQRQPILTAPEPVNVRRSPEPVEETAEEPAEKKSRNLSEFVKFGILAVILLGTPVVIFLLIPLIFGQIVPAVLGSDLPGNNQTLPGDQVIQPPTAETPNVLLPTDPQTGIGGEATPTPVLLETATTEPSFHVVRSGETLFSIAGRYGLTADELAAANNILDPNQIFSGQVLILPPPSNP